VPPEPLDHRVRRAQEAIDRDRLIDICCALVDTPSPTGDEGPLAHVIAGLLDAAGVPGNVQPLDERQANAWGRVEGNGTGRSVMLYAPIDTLTTGDPHLDLPHAAATMEPHLVPHAVVAGGRIVGLGAMNPKGHAACIIGAVEAIVASAIALDGDVVAAFGAGGMPTNPLPDGATTGRHTGHGVGCSFLLEHGVSADAAVIAKSGWAVSWEEVGLAWFDVTVRGTHTYVGARHLLPYRNAIADLATVVQFLEAWFAERAARWTDEHPDSYVEPQGVVAAVTGGWQRMPAFTPAQATVRVDLRLAPEQTPASAQRELETALAALVAETPGLDVAVEPVVGIMGSRTDADHWIVRHAVDAWEAETGETHVAARRTSGATDANILRNHGIPTARVGLPKSTNADGSPIGFGPGMNTVDVDALVTLTKYLVRVAVTATAATEAAA
jgi:acetylornithine deacetylase/succinyl-diaminopimelate desuccinylase-like protein